VWLVTVPSFVVKAGIFGDMMHGAESIAAHALDFRSLPGCWCRAGRDTQRVIFGTMSESRSTFWVFARSACGLSSWFFLTFWDNLEIAFVH
jgi:hypothetical protein